MVTPPYAYSDMPFLHLGRDRFADSNNGISILELESPILDESISQDMHLYRIGITDSGRIDQPEQAFQNWNPRNETITPLVRPLCR